MAERSADGRITNVHDLVDDSINKYNTVVDEWNKWIEGTWNKATAEEQENLKQEKENLDHKLKVAKSTFDQEQQVLKQYEETIDLIDELEEARRQKRREERDKELEKLDYTLEVKLDVK